MRPSREPLAMCKRVMIAALFQRPAAHRHLHTAGTSRTPAELPESAGCKTRLQVAHYTVEQTTHESEPPVPKHCMLQLVPHTWESVLLHMSQSAVLHTSQPVLSQTAKCRPPWRIER